MTRLLEDALRKVSKLSEDEQDGIASQILETLEDEEAWGKMLRKNPAKLRQLAEKARGEDRGRGILGDRGNLSFEMDSHHGR